MPGKKESTHLSTEILQILRACEHCIGGRNFVHDLFHTWKRERLINYERGPDPLRHALIMAGAPGLSFNGPTPDFLHIQTVDVHATIADYWRRWRENKDLDLLQQDAAALLSRLNAHTKRLDAAFREHGFATLKDGRDRRSARSSGGRKASEAAKIRSANWVAQVRQHMQDTGERQADAIRAVYRAHIGKSPSISESRLRVLMAAANKGIKR